MRRVRQAGRGRGGQHSVHAFLPFLPNRGLQSIMEKPKRHHNLRLKSAYLKRHNPLKSWVDLKPWPEMSITEALGTSALQENVRFGGVKSQVVNLAYVTAPVGSTHPCLEVTLHTSKVVHGERTWTHPVNVLSHVMSFLCVRTKGLILKSEAC